MSPEYKTPPAYKFKYEFDHEFGNHVWYDNKVTGTVFTFNSSLYTKDASFESLKEKLMVPLRSAYISGDIGDIIFSLPAVRYLGVTTLYLNVDPKYKLRRIGETKFNAKGAEALIPLIKEQPYIKECKLYNGEKVDFNLDLFRYHGDLTYTNLCKAIMETFNCPLEEMNKQWLYAEPVRKEKIVLINKTDRYLNNEVNWGWFLENYGPLMAFVGVKSEYEQFIQEFNYNIPFYETKDFLELAQLIAGCDLFIGNQSSPNAINEGLKHQNIQVVCDECPNCLFERQNAFYLPEKYTLRYDKNFRDQRQAG